MNRPALRVLNNETAAEAGGLNRRQVMQRMLGTAGAGLALPGLATGHPVHSHLMSDSTMSAAEAAAADANWEPAFLDPHQNETLIVLAERIVPNSTTAQVNRFVDLLISVDTQENQKKFLSSLGAFDHEGITRYDQPFKDLNEDRQVEILTAASTAKAGGPPPENYGSRPERAAKAGEEPVLTMRDHFENVKSWVSGAFYSSEVGMRELGWTGQVVWDSFPGCEHPEGHNS
ncbi:MAG TPA: gluconate 2-dehydrogenase subunit 3 family protein [Terriglobia bacterium]|nr:gluconate 2-dehydrogenase subunit 3 family protein [Terriglobia bacterium]